MFGGASVSMPPLVAGEWKVRLLPRHMDRERQDAIAYSSADEELRTTRGSRGGVREVRRLRSREDRGQGGSGGGTDRRVGADRTFGQPESRYAR